MLNAFASLKLVDKWYIILENSPKKARALIG